MVSDGLTLGVGLPLLVFQKSAVSGLDDAIGQLAPCSLSRGDSGGVPYLKVTSPSWPPDSYFRSR